MTIEVTTSLSESFPDKNFGKEPFNCFRFFKICEESKVIGPEAGWQPLYFVATEGEEIKGFLPAFIKDNSFGEFIFDWAWADLYQRSGLPYYPKLVSAIPFSPVNVNKALANDEETKKELLEAFSGFLNKNKVLSSGHCLFLDEYEAQTLEKEGFFIRTTLQYHLDWKHPSFESFLKALKARKRKQIRKERKAINDSGIEIKTFESEFSQAFMDQVYELYLTTIDKKCSQAYLNRQFFRNLGRQMPEALVVIGAFQGDEMKAMSLFLKSEDTLYGRYWGVEAGFEIEYLHFELSYYQGMEYCAKHDLKRFEAGAQGEQKLLRGFRPVEIISAHKLAIPQAHAAIRKHTEAENKFYKEQQKALNRHLPYKETDHGQVT